MIDGLNVAGQMIVVALIICADGTPSPPSLGFDQPESVDVVLIGDLAVERWQAS